MGYPDLKSDESIILTAQYIKVKSVPFELVLTNRRLIVIDSERNTAPTQQIPLVTIRNVTMGENAIRDPVITLTILTDTADTRELALTFAMQTAGDRKREAAEWAKTLKKYIAEAASRPAEPVQAVSPTEPSRPEHIASQGIKKKIEISRPIKKITVDTSNLPPKPVETSSLPEGSFCCRCGNRIPEGSSFCNRCGTPVVAAGEVPTNTPAPAQISISPAGAAGSGDRKGRPIEQIIHSIEPLIEDSVPRTTPAPAIPEPVAAPVEAPAEASPAAPTETTPGPAQEGTTAPEAAPATPQATTQETVPTAATAPAPAAAPADAAAPAVPPVPPVQQLPPVPEAPKKKSSKVLTLAIIAVVIIAIAVGGVLVMKNLQKAPAVTPVTTTIPTTVATTIPTTKPTTVATTVPATAIPTTVQYIIPQTGVWVEIIYDKTYTGQVGMPGGLITVSDTGDHFYSIPTSQGTVAVSVKKTDGSASELKVIVYKDGTALKTATTSTPRGSIDLQYSITTPTPTSIPATETVKESETASESATPVTTESSGSTTKTGVTITNSTA